MHLEHGNLLAGVPFGAGDEIFTPLLQRPGLRVDRIVSNGQATPPGEWQDNPEGEWVVLLVGSAELHFDGSPAPYVMLPGAWVHIPAHCRHRIEWTDQQQATVWLAIHYDPAQGGG